MHLTKPPSSLGPWTVGKLATFVCKTTPGKIEMENKTSITALRQLIVIRKTYCFITPLRKSVLKDTSSSISLGRIYKFLASLDILDWTKIPHGQRGVGRQGVMFAMLAYFILVNKMGIEQPYLPIPLSEQ